MSELYLGATHKEHEPNTKYIFAGYGLLLVDINGGGYGTSFYLILWGAHVLLGGTSDVENVVDLTHNGDSHTLSINYGYYYKTIFYA